MCLTSALPRLWPVALTPTTAEPTSTRGKQCPVPLSTPQFSAWHTSWLHVQSFLNKPCSMHSAPYPSCSSFRHESMCASVSLLGVYAQQALSNVCILQDVSHAIQQQARHLSYADLCSVMQVYSQAVCLYVMVTLDQPIKLCQANMS